MGTISRFCRTAGSITGVLLSSATAWAGAGPPAGDAEPPPAVVFAIIGGAFPLSMAVCAVIFFTHPALRVILARKLAEADVDVLPPRGFHLTHTTTKAGPHYLCLRFRLASETHRYGMTVRYRLEGAGQVVEEAVGHGSTPPEPYDRWETRTYMSVASRGVGIRRPGGFSAWRGSPALRAPSSGSRAW